MEKGIFEALELQSLHFPHSLHPLSFEGVSILVFENQVFFPLEPPLEGDREGAPTLISFRIFSLLDRSAALRLRVQDLSQFFF